MIFALNFHFNGQKAKGTQTDEMNGKQSIKHWIETFEEEVYQRDGNDFGLSSDEIDFKTAVVDKQKQEKRQKRIAKFLIHIPVILRTIQLIITATFSYSLFHVNAW